MSKDSHVFCHREISVAIFPEEMRTEIRSLSRTVDRPSVAAKKRREFAAGDTPVATLVLLLTQACNLACRYCYGDKGRFGAAGIMSKETANTAVDWLIEKSGHHRTLRIGFLGGEPFLNFDVLMHTVLYARAQAKAVGKSVKFYTTTNGTLLDKDKIEFLKDHAVAIQVSLDGPKKLHDRNRPFANGRGSWEQITDGVARLLSASPDASAHAVLSEGSDPTEVRDALIAAGFKDVSILPASGSLFGDLAALSEGDEEALSAYLLLVENDAEAWLDAIRARNRETLSRLFLTTGLSVPIRALLYDIRKNFACGAGIGLLGVGCDGGLYPCHRFAGQPEWRIGHVSSDELDRSDHLASPLTQSAECRSCIARYTCAGGCKHDNLTATGKLYDPAPRNCRLRRRQVEMAAWVVAQLDEGDRQFAKTTKALQPKPCPLDL